MRLRVADEDNKLGTRLISLGRCWSTSYYKGRRVDELRLVVGLTFCLVDFVHFERR
jgi:hypothetical protein